MRTLIPALLFLVACAHTDADTASDGLSAVHVETFECNDLEYYKNTRGLYPLVSDVDPNGFQILLCDESGTCFDVTDEGVIEEGSILVYECDPGGEIRLSYW